MIFISYYALFLFPSRPCAPKRANYGRKTKFPSRFYENSLDLTKYFCYNDYMIKYMQFSAKKLAILSVLTALGLVAFLLENLLPPLFVPLYEKYADYTIDCDGHGVEDTVHAVCALVKKLGM